MSNNQQTGSLQRVSPVCVCQMLRAETEGLVVQTPAYPELAAKVQSERKPAVWCHQRGQRWHHSGSPRSVDTLIALMPPYSTKPELAAAPSASVYYTAIVFIYRHDLCDSCQTVSALSRHGIRPLGQPPTRQRSLLLFLSPHPVFLHGHCSPDGPR